MDTSNRVVCDNFVDGIYGGDVMITKRKGSITVEFGDGDICISGKAKNRIAYIELSQIKKGEVGRDLGFDFDTPKPAVILKFKTPKSMMVLYENLAELLKHTEEQK